MSGNKFRQFKVVPDAVTMARHLKFPGDDNKIRDKLSEMARLGVPVRGYSGALRYGRYVLEIEADEVVWVGTEPPEDLREETGIKESTRTTVQKDRYGGRSRVRVFDLG